MTSDFYFHRPILIFLLISVHSLLFSQQVPDTSFRYTAKQVAYNSGKGPLIMIDAAHHNFHTRSGGFLPFAKLLEGDGFVLVDNHRVFNSKKALKNCKLLVVANALDIRNTTSWVLPTPSAFSDKEIEALKKWVSEGGRLLLIADHMPFAGAAQKLAQAFGFEFLNGFALSIHNASQPIEFKKDSLLLESPIRKGRKPSEEITKVVSFTGSAFLIPDSAIGVLKFSQNYRSLQPDTAWAFHSHTPEKNLKGYFQGAVMKYGKGKIAVFGEAAMFTAQIVNNRYKVGMNSESAPENAQLVLNLVHWLDQD